MTRGVFIPETKGNNNGVAFLHQKKNIRGGRLLDPGGHWECDSTGLVLGRFCQHRLSTGPVLVCIQGVPTYSWSWRKAGGQTSWPVNYMAAWLRSLQRGCTTVGSEEQGAIIIQKRIASMKIVYLYTLTFG